MELRFFSETGTVWALSGDRAKIWSDGDWTPAAGSAPMAVEVLGSWDCKELSAAEASAVLSALGAPAPSFSRQDGSRAA